jgi:hypothetical protein
MKALYKYPQAEYPYTRLIEENRSRGLGATEFELIDTGLFDEDRYFDMFAEYAKSAANDILIRITVENHGPDSSTLHLLPTLWFRNTWSWGKIVKECTSKPSIELEHDRLARARHEELASITSPTKGTQRRFSRRMKQMRCATAVRQTVMLTRRMRSTNTSFTAIRRR